MSMDDLFVTNAIVAAAGGATATSGTVIFSNANNVSFGLVGQTITASASSPADVPFAISAGTQSASTGTVAFSNSNNVSFGMAGSSIVTASVASSLTNINVSAGTTSNNLSAVVFSNSNNVSFGLNGSTVTATASVASSQGSINLSAGTTSNLASAFTFSNSNGVSFGLNASTITASVATSLTNINVSAGTTSNNLSAVVFSNSNRVSFGLNGSTVTAQHALNFSAGTTSQNVSDQIVFSNSNGVSFGLNGSTITASVAAAAASVNISAGTTSNNLTAFTLSNSNGVSFGINASTITASVATSLTNINVSAGTTSNNLSAVVFSNSNRVSFGLNGSTVTAQYALNFSAGTTSQNVSDQIVFSNSNGVSFGLNGSTITANPGYLSFYENGPGLFNTTAQTFDGASLSYCIQFILPLAGSFSFMRIPVQMTTNSTSLATTAQAATNFRMGLFSTVNAVVYSLATGASSRSFTSVASGSAGFTQSNAVSITNTTQYSFSDAFTYQVEGGQTSASSQWSVSQTRIDLVTTNWQNQYSFVRMLDINFANSLSAGAYMLVIGMSSSSSTNNASYAAGTNANVRYSNHYGQSQINFNLGLFGSTNRTTGAVLGAGSFSTAGGGTTAAFPVSAISSASPHGRLYFQLIRSA